MVYGEYCYLIKVHFTNIVLQISASPHELGFILLCEHMEVAWIMLTLFGCAEYWGGGGDGILFIHLYIYRMRCIYRVYLSIYIMKRRYPPQIILMQSFTSVSFLLNNCRIVFLKKKKGFVWLLLYLVDNRLMRVDLPCWSYHVDEPDTDVLGGISPYSTMIQK